MSRPQHFVHDVAGLATHAFGHRSLTWWGLVGFMLIEGSAFLLAVVAYFFLMSHQPEWAPRPWHPPGLIAGTLFTIGLLLSEIPNSMIKRAARDYETPAVRRLLLVMTLVGLVLLVVRGFEFNALNVLWYDNAYGSIIWALLILHTTHIMTDWFDTVVLWRLMNTAHGEEPRRMVDTDENAMYWRFVWISWLPIYMLIYWVPRMFR